MNGGFLLKLNIDIFDLVLDFIDTCNITIIGKIYGEIFTL